MENNENPVEGNAPELLGMNLDYDGGNTLHEATRWSKLQSVSTFVCGGLMLLLVVVYGPQQVERNAESDNIGVLELVLVGIGLFLAAAIVGAVFLLRFTTMAKKSMQSQDQVTFNRGLKSLKIYFVIVAVLSIAVLGELIYGLITILFFM